MHPVNFKAGRKKIRRKNWGTFSKTVSKARGQKKENIHKQSWPDQEKFPT